MNNKVEILPEDMTFKVLSRKPYHEMYHIITHMPEIEFDTLFAEGALDSFLAQHGWTWEEFSEEYTKALRNNNVNR